MSDLDEEARSTDGSDSEGSLVEFITKDNSDDEEEEVDEDNRDEATALVEDFPYDRSLLEEDTSQNGLRRSRRQRKQTTRYVDPDNYNKLMFGDVDNDALDSSSSEDDKVNEDEDFEIEENDDMDESTDDDDEEEEEEEEKPAKKRKISSKITTTEDTKSGQKWDHMKMC